MQDAFDEYCAIVQKTFSDDFWSIFASVHRERVGVIERVLKSARDVFVHDTKMRRRFPISMRNMQIQARSAAGDFSTHILHEIDVDLSKFPLPGDVKPTIKFRFVNPLWAWIQAANEMVSAGHSMFFKPQIMLNESGDRLHGAGVQFGDALKWASARTPRGRLASLFGISFDGGDSGVSNRTVYPICVSALNFNSSDPMQCGLVGFVPQMEVPASFKDTEAFRSARAHILQECVGAILDELENVATGGFTAYIGKERMHFQPFLVAVRVDSKERKTYFGLKSDRYTHSYAHTYMTSYMTTDICAPIYDY